MYWRPRTIDDAVAVLEAGKATVLSGGTDLYPAHAGKSMPSPLLDLSDIAELRGLSLSGGIYRIGAATTWSEIITASLPPAFECLKAAAREIGSVQIQNRGTIAGNICNASPAADGIPPLLTLDARVELRSPRGPRELKLSQFVTGYRQTVLAADELVTAIAVPAPPPRAHASFVKLGARRYLVISILMAAAVIEYDDKDCIASAAVAVGAASPVARRLPDLENDLLGLARSIAPSSVVAASHLNPLSPIDDVRGTAEYRRDAAFEIVGAALDRAAGFKPA